MITLRTPEETLVVVPHIIGYMPSRRLVLCGLDQHGTDAAGERACIGPIVTVDYREDGLADDHGRLVSDVVRRHGVTKAVIVLYCDDLDELDGHMRRRLAELHAAAARAMAPVGSGFLATFAADGTRFTRIDGDDGAVRSLRELDSSEAAAHLVYEGSAPLPSRPAADIQPKPEALREQARLAARRIEDWPLALEDELALMDLLVTARTGGAVASLPGAASLACPRSDGPEGTQARRSGELRVTAFAPHALGEPAGAPAALSPPDEASGEAAEPARDEAEDWARLCGMASHALTDTEVRDRVLLYGIDPGVCLPLLSLSQQDVADGLAAATECAPDIDRLRSMCALLEEIASYRAPGEHAALAAAGYLHWWSCSNTMAAHRALSAVKLEPGYPLADLLLDVVNSGIMAPWYERRKECDGQVAEHRPGRVA
ncbi:MAG: DUF4192 family protein [Actinomycetaceae bacterium]|nr:DUF4192 family protein [Actinomycetaceae bacterium]